MTTPNAYELFTRAQELFLAGDGEAIADLYAADGVIENPFAPPGIPRRVAGRDAIRAHLVRALASTRREFRGFDSRALHRTTDPEVVISEHDVHGVTKGTADPFRMSYIQVLRARDGEIVSWRDYFDPLPLLPNAAAPAEGSQA